MTSLNPVMRIGAQITESLKAHEGMTRQAGPRRERSSCLSMVGIPKPASRLADYPHQFSGGMRQRVMIAMALACSPELLIADEPTTALDVTIQAQIVELVKRLQAEFGTAVIWISHDLGVVARLADRVAVMYAGYIVEQAPVDESLRAPGPSLYTRPSQLAAAARYQGENEARGHQGAPAQPDRQRCTAARSSPAAHYATDRCRIDNPPSPKSRPDHAVACWNHLMKRQVDAMNETGPGPRQPAEDAFPDFGLASASTGPRVPSRPSTASPSTSERVRPSASSARAAAARAQPAAPSFSSIGRPAAR